MRKELKIAPKIIEDVSRENLSKIRKAICGERIGWGMHRVVYEYKHNPNYVVKIEYSLKDKEFANITEYRNWEYNKESPLGKWLAPVIFITKNGKISIQRKIEHGFVNKYPKTIPVVFTDLKKQNYGWMDGRFVCCDYAYIVLDYLIIKKEIQHRIVKWWVLKTKKK